MKLARALIALSPLLTLPAAAQGVATDIWSNVVRWRLPDGYHAVAAHATLLPDGRVFFTGYARDTEDPLLATDGRLTNFELVPTPAFLPTPLDHVATELDPPLDIEGAVFGNTFVADNLFCAGQTLTAEGAVFTAGGTRNFFDLVTEESFTHGLAYATEYDGTSWTRIPEDMAVISSIGVPARWYPAVTRLHDGRLLVTGGYDVVAGGFANLSAEAYDPATGTWEILSDYGQAPPEIFNSDYTHPALLPHTVDGFDVLMFGAAGLPVLLSLEGPERWSVSAQGRPGTQPFEAPNTGASSTLLPVRARNGEWGYANGSMLIAGGDHDTSHQESVDVYDPVQDAWLPRVDMGVERHHPTSVLLPDGRIAVLAGHDNDGDPNLGRASYIDPANGFTAQLGLTAATEVRGYHNVAVLLPDGRVLVGGGQDLETGEIPEKSTFRYLYPSYMFAERPVIQFAPQEIGYGGRFLMFATGKRPVEVVLMGLGSMTHSMDFNQRHVQLRMSKLNVPAPASSTHLFVRGPADARVAPPGYYMLFVLDEDRIPSEAAIVRLR